MKWTAFNTRRCWHRLPFRLIYLKTTVVNLDPRDIGYITESVHVQWCIIYTRKTVHLCDNVLGQCSNVMVRYVFCSISSLNVSQHHPFMFTQYMSETHNQACLTWALIFIRIFNEMYNEFGSYVADWTIVNVSVRPDRAFINITYAR